MGVSSSPLDSTFLTGQLTTTTTILITADIYVDTELGEKGLGTTDFTASSKQAQHLSLTHQTTPHHAITTTAVSNGRANNKLAP